MEQYATLSENKDLINFIQFANKTFSNKKKVMAILKNLNPEGIIIKDSNQQANDEENIKTKKEEKKKTLVGKQSIQQLSFIKVDSSEEISDEKEKINNLEISYVNEEKQEKQNKNISQVENMIKDCEADIKKLEAIIKKFKYSGEGLMMESRIFDDKSMVAISKIDEDNQENDEAEKNYEYFKDVKKKYDDLKQKLQKLLSLYNSEKNLTEIKKKELDNLEQQLSKKNKK